MNHEDREDHGRTLSGNYRMRVASPLTAHAERVVAETIGCAIRVHKALGPGFLESIYKPSYALTKYIALS